jgi:hypothetical protein
MSTLLSNQMQKAKHYQTNQQVKYLHLEAEVDMLLQKLTSLTQRKELSSILSELAEPVNSN